ncbi:MAG: YlxR family protein [Actinomycetota bacterium]
MVRQKGQMLRIVRRPDGSVSVDATGSAPGRGAYVCGAACARLARGRFARALRAPGVDYAEIVAAVEAAVGDGT